MNAIRAIVKSGRLELDAPADWPDGTEVLIEPAGIFLVAGIDECQWSGDPDSLADWDVWIKTSEPLEFTPEEASRMDQFDQKMRQFNIDASGRLMQGTSGQ